MPRTDRVDTLSYIISSRWDYQLNVTCKRTSRPFGAGIVFIHKNGGLHPRLRCFAPLGQKTKTLQALHLIVDILSCEAKFLIEHLVRSGEAEAAETPYLTLITRNEAFEVNGQTGCETELLHTSRQNLCLIVG